MGCDADTDEAELPANGTSWLHDRGEQLAPFEIRTSPGRHVLVKIEERGAPIAAMIVHGGSTAEMTVPLGSFTIKYATGAGQSWCGHTAQRPFGQETSFYKADETFHFRDEGDHYAGYVVELILHRDGNLPTRQIPPEEW